MTPADVRHALLTRAEIALLDVREEAEFAVAHPLFAANLSLSRLEEDAFARLPRRNVPIVVYNDGDGRAARAAARLSALGYTDVREMAGGLQGWAAAGLELFQDVNSYCKAFGELVEARRHTPSLPPEAVQAQLAGDAPPVVLDARRFDEFATMSIPGARSAPGAELLLAVAAEAPDPATPIIVNCAGRTRSLIGTQSLVNAGIPNPVFALRNGTIGWTLAGQALDKGAATRAAGADAAALTIAQARARSVAYRAGVRHLDLEGLERLEADTGRTLYRFDVRQPEAHAEGRPKGFLNYPGGQLVQETDMAAPVRGARIVVWDDTGVRADMTASWLAQMGWDAYVLAGDVAPRWAAGPEPRPRADAPTVPLVSPSEVEAAVAAGALLVDLAPSPQFRRGTIPGARFAIRARLEADLGTPTEVILTSPDGTAAAWAAADLRAAGIAVRALAGGTAAWAAEGRPLAPGSEDTLSPFEDVYRRPYEGTDNPVAAMQAYLDWEFGLVAQLERDATHGFVVI